MANTPVNKTKEDMNTPSDNTNDLSKITIEELEKEYNEKQYALDNKEAMKLVRCIISCNNKNKTAYSGEIFCVRNEELKEVKKFVPFGVTTHVPKILLNMIKEKQLQVFREERVPNGNKVTKTTMIPEYNISELDPITPEELEAIKKKQLAEGFNGE